LLINPNSPVNEEYPRSEIDGIKTILAQVTIPATGDPWKYR
jgi:hypothetical protein